MEFFHVTLLKNVESILENGLLASKGGLDGPGVYLWRGPLEDAVREADWSLSDNHCEMSQDEYDAFTKGLVMLAVDVPGGTVFSVEWPEYVVWDCNVVPRSQIVSLGCFHDLLERYSPRKSVLDVIVEATEKANEGCCDCVYTEYGSPQL